MRDRNYTSEAFVLAQKNFSEADRILVLYTKRFGKISFIAKGVRKPKSRKRGMLQPFNEVKISASRGRGIDLITEAESIKNFAKLKSDLKRVALAYYMVETIGRTMQEDEKNEEVYQLLQDYFRKLETTRKLRSLKDSFSVKLVEMLGFWPKGKPLANPDLFLENILEKKLGSIRVGKKILSQK